MSGNEILRILYSHTTINQKSRPDHKGIEHSIDSMMQTYVKKKGRGVIPPINIVPTGVFEDGSTQYTSFNNRRLTALKKVLVNMSAQEIASFKVMVNVLNPDSDASYNIQGYTEGATNLDMIKYRTGGNTLGYSNIPTLRQPSDQKEEKKDS